MLSESQRKKIIEFVKLCVSQNDSFHGIAHAEETARMAVWFSGQENANGNNTNEDICWVSGMLHDICKSKGKLEDHATLGAKEARVFLDSLDRFGADSQFAERVADAIHFHNKEFRDGSLERQILWDSDKFYIMTPDGFMKRMLPYWISKLGESAGRDKAVSEYYFYYERFHTDTAKKEIAKYRGELEGLFTKI